MPLPSFTRFSQVLIVSLVLTLMSCLLVWAACPECYSNQTPLAGHGPAPDGSGRRLISVQIDSSWGNPTNNSIWNGTAAAMSQWNNATDSFGNRTAYYLQINQTTSTPDYIIRQGTLTDPNNCAEISVTGPPYFINLPADTTSFTAAEIRIQGTQLGRWAWDVFLTKSP